MDAKRPVWLRQLKSLCYNKYSTAIGITIAVLQDLLSFNNAFTVMGPVQTVTEEYIPPENWKPCDTTLKVAYFTNTRGNKVTVRMRYEEKWIAKDGETELGLTFIDQNDGIEKPYSIIHFQNQADWIYNSEDHYCYYELKLGRGYHEKLVDVNR